MIETTARPTLIIYRRAGCHLCDDAEILLRDELAVRARAGLPLAEVEHVDISTDPELEARYRRRIPVFVVGDEESELVTNARQVRDFLEHALPTSTG
ncbi:MAG: glutaredoxin family protein [Chloroflexota bacterium]|nr:glutaredoxin family protein [Chloroflexota bacterium]